MSAREARRGRLRGLAGNLGLVVVSVVVVLLIAEAGTRLLSRTGPALLVTDPVVGKRFVPGFEGHVFVDEAGREIALRFNAEGFRDPDRPRRKPAGAHRVALVGDSMVAAIATEETHTLVRRLEASLREWQPEKDFEVLNFGVSSSSTGQELVLYRELVSAYEPDVVLLALFVGNDFADNSRRLTRAPRIYFDLDPDGTLRQGPAPGAPRALNRWLNHNSRFYVWQKQAFRRLRSSGRAWRGGLEPVQRVFERPDDPDLAHAWALLSALLGRFKAEVEAGGSLFALVVIPSAEQVHDDLWEALVARAGDGGSSLDRERPRRRLAAIAESEGIALLDLTAAFRRAAVGGTSLDEAASPFLLGRFHLSDEGNRLAAEEVFLFLRGQVLQQVSPGRAGGTP
ncbi:MAG: hypothetical protein PVJ73_08445 [Acidobacteriota bacterium]